MILVVMGVSGCGKTSVGKGLAHKLEWQYIEGDDYHPKSNKTKMSQGIPLTDQDRYPWLLSLHQTIAEWLNEEKNGIVTCSALKKSYRDILKTGLTPGGQIQNQISPGIEAPPGANTSGYTDTPHRVLFVYLKGSEEVLKARMETRQGHFMPAGLLQSQLATLEEPGPEELSVTVDVDNSLDKIITQVLNTLRKLTTCQQL